MGVALLSVGGPRMKDGHWFLSLELTSRDAAATILAGKHEQKSQACAWLFLFDNVC